MISSQSYATTEPSWDDELDRGKIKKVKVKGILKHPGSDKFQAVHEELKRVKRVH